MGLGVFLTLKSSNPVSSGKTLPVGEASSISLLCCLEYVTRTDYSKTDEEVAVVGRIEAAVGGAANHWIDDPGAATQYTTCPFIID